MSGAGTIRITAVSPSLHRVRLKLDKLSRMGTENLLDRVGALIESQTRRRISEERTDPDGRPWKKLDLVYAARKRRGTKRDPASTGDILVRYGRMLDSVTHNVNDDEIEIGASVDYAPFVDFDRPFLGLSRDNEKELDDELDDWLGEITR